MGNPVVHFELNGPQWGEVAKFYTDLFGWSTQEYPQMNYTTVDTHAGGGINGGLGKTQEGQPSFVTFYVETPDPQGALDKAESLGAKTVVPVTEMEMVTFAMFTDPAGAVIGLVKGDGSDQGPGVSAGDNPKVDWFEVLAADPKSLWNFYSELFGWKVQDSSGEGFVYGQVDTQAGGRGIGGGIGSSPDGTARVNVYAGVDDLQKYVEKAESLGGKTVVPPTDVMENLSIAHIQDPQGTTFGLYKGM